ncbi:cobaltochelatase subunit CobN [Methylocapsa sp. D3K7]|uniref:cobaltochelatase subunit CobN n=1 Tax=Methylocapsa sp. D3K7 TaxID=3041435 RepID=UPI00244E65B3|nr:cobaltochelatase subunit CobN [Methylocapsa sp. D3K7]WGJ15474.1 cobaltochelatase subunit CobN [Methylocapsa sp. D3K7]
MHLLRTESRSLDETEAAIDLGQSPAELLFLSFSDSDLSLIAAAARQRPMSMSLRLANLGALKHPYSVDLYIGKAASHARFVLIRLLGGLEYWRYGIEEFSRAARKQNFKLAIIPGDAMEDERLDEASTVPAVDLRQMHAAFQHGQLEHIAELFDFIESRAEQPFEWRHSPKVREIPAAGHFEAGCRTLGCAKGKALIVFYRSLMLAGDTAPVNALADALAARRLDVSAIFVASLKDSDAIAFIRAHLACVGPDVILNTTGFSARLDTDAGVLDSADVPVLQAIFTGATEVQWQQNPRGLGAADLAMNIVLPEMDGRLITCAIACKAEAGHRADLEFTPRVHAPLPSRVTFVGDLAAAWVNLRKTPPAKRKIACVISDYPGKQGRTGYAVGLDTAKSVISIAKTLREAGYDIGLLPDSSQLMRGLENAAPTGRLTLAEYVAALEAMSPAFVQSTCAEWGPPGSAAQDGGFAFSVLRANNLLVAVQPDRGIAENRKSDYHDTGLPPCHSYVAFYVWLRQCEKIDAMIHCGTHGTLEWLPGKAAALTDACAPEAVLGPLPVIYPFIVSNPGEAAQAKRRICALTIGHMTPPLTLAGSHGVALEIEALFDEYAIAESLDPKRARLLAQAILDRAGETGLLQDSGLKDTADPAAALRHLDAFLCDLKDMRIADGLHVFGQSPDPAVRDAIVETLTQTLQDTCAQLPDDVPSFSEQMRTLIDCCGDAESDSLIAALDGRFVVPGPGGAPSRGRIDVLPTGRNLYGIDPRAVPTRTAWEIGQRAAREITNRHIQDHGEWPKAIVMDLWASSTMRTGGDDLAQAFALMGVKPLWDHSSARVTGFEIVSPARLAYPRVDVTLRISGLFRDVFPAQIVLFDQAVQALSEQDEEDAVNPYAAVRRQAPGKLLRIFGGAPGAYGIGLGRAIGENATLARETLGERYLATASHAYGGADGEAVLTRAFATRVACADALIHVQDQDEQDILDSDAIADHEGGFSAAANILGNDAAVYHVSSARPDALRVRTLGEEIARVVHARASNPRWIAGQMRHGHRGAAEIAGTIDNLYALAILSDAVQNQHFELLFDATLGTPAVWDFLVESNPKAAFAIVQKFEQALARGFWQNRRNSILASLASMREALA